MNKNRLFLLVSILTLIILLGTAATCNMCGLNLTTETTTSTTEESQTGNTSTQVSETEETTKVSLAEDTNEEKTTDTTKSNSTDTAKSSSTDAQAAAPTIKLQIYEGPTYSQADDVCYYRIEAVVTGSPAPLVTFSKDDSSGAFGSKKVQVNLTQSNQNYTLTAKAKNSSGEAEAAIDLKWGCGPIQAIIKTIELHPTIVMTVGPSGFTDLSVAGIGDSQFNTDWRGRFAFNVSILEKKKIEGVSLKLTNPQMYNDCSFKGNIYLNYNDFLPDITSSNYFNAAYAPANNFTWDADPLEISDDFLKNKVIERAETGLELQFGMSFEKNISDNDGVADGRAYKSGDITLKVMYFDQ